MVRIKKLVVNPDDSEGNRSNDILIKKLCPNFEPVK